MSRPPKKSPEKCVEVHIYMTFAMKVKLTRIAVKNHRSVTGQIEHYIKMGLDREREEVVSR